MGKCSNEKFEVGYSDCLACTNLSAKHRVNYSYYIEKYHINLKFFWSVSWNYTIDYDNLPKELKEYAGKTTGIQILNRILSRIKDEKSFLIFNILSAEKYGIYINDYEIIQQLINFLKQNCLERRTLWILDSQMNNQISFDITNMFKEAELLYLDLRSIYASDVRIASIASDGHLDPFSQKLLVSHIFSFAVSHLLSE